MVLEKSIPKTRNSKALPGGGAKTSTLASRARVCELQPVDCKSKKIQNDVLIGLTRHEKELGFCLK